MDRTVDFSEELACVAACTGLARFPPAAAGPLYKRGAGPAPEYFQFYCFQCESASALEESVNERRPLRKAISGLQHILGSQPRLVAILVYRLAPKPCLSGK
jgi:hypothetical protein